MYTRDGVRPAPVDGTGVPRNRLFAGFGQTTLLALAAMLSCGLLIAVGAALSMCWMVHPLLFAIAGIGLIWGAGRGAGRLFRTSSVARGR